jgi:AraC-like DNA-binding protein
LNETDTVSLYRELAEPRAVDVVYCWWDQKIGPGAQRYVQRVLPDGCADVIVSANGDAAVVGPTMSVGLPQLAPGTHIRGLRLRTEALATVLGWPGSELRDMTVPLSAVLSGPMAREVTEAVWELRLPERLSRVHLDGRVRHAVKRLLRSDRTDVGTVAAEVGVTERHLRRLLVDHTGIGPRSLQRVGRLQRFLALADEEWPAVSLARLAAMAGYADQAHLTRDVGELAGLTPILLLRERRGGV